MYLGQILSLSKGPLSHFHLLVFKNSQRKYLFVPFQKAFIFQPFSFLPLKFQSFFWAITTTVLHFVVSCAVFAFIDRTDSGLKGILIMVLPWPFSWVSGWMTSGLKSQPLSFPAAFLSKGEWIKDEKRAMRRRDRLVQQYVEICLWEAS